MDFDLYWQAVRWLALEHVHVETSSNEITAGGLIVGSFDNAPLRLRYQLTADAEWRTTRFRIEDLTADEHVELERIASGTWRAPNGDERTDLTAAIDIDIAATPFTNTLPIRRLNLEPGQSAEIAVVYVNVTPVLSLRASRQRYTRLRNDSQEERYLYESLESDFTRELLVDEHGFVIDYPGIWRRALVPGST